jgi:hypothetical protein
VGFNRRKMEDQRRQAAEKEAAGRRATDADGADHGRLCLAASIGGLSAFSDDLLGYPLDGIADVALEDVVSGGVAKTRERSRESRWLATPATVWPPVLLMQ